MKGWKNRALQRADYKSACDWHVRLMIWLMLGVILSISAAAMLVSGSFHPDRFYDIGNRYELIEDELKAGYNGIAYDGQTLCVDGVEAWRDIDLTKLEGSWRYGFFRIEDLSEPSFEVKFHCYDREENLVWDSIFEMKEGENFVEFPKNDFSFLNMYIYDAKGLRFNLTSVIISEEMPLEVWKVWFAAAVIMVLYAAVSATLVWKRKHTLRVCSVEKPVLVLQSIYLKISQVFIERMEILPKRLKRVLRTALFTFLFFITYYLNDQGIRTRYDTMLRWCVVILLLTAVLSFEKYGQGAAWNENHLVKAWMWMCLLLCVSDFFIRKDYRFTGWVFLIVLGLFYFAWGTMWVPEELLWELKFSLQITFWATVLYCVFGEPYITDSMRYGGTWKNPNPFACYMAFCAAAWLSDFYASVKKKNMNWRMPVSAAGLVISIYYICKAQTRVALFAAVCCIAVVIGSILFINGRLNIKKLLLLSAGGSLAALALLGLGLFFKIGIAERIVSSGTSGRVYIWTNYLRNMNLIGHASTIKLNGVKCFSHNSMIYIMYHYGVFALIPYIIIIIMAFYGVFRYMKKNREKREYGVFLLGTFVTYVICSSLESVEEIPFVWPIWTGFYLCIGFLFQKPIAEKGVSETEQGRNQKKR